MEISALFGNKGDQGAALTAAMAMPATAREGMGAAEDPRPRQWNGREVARLVPDEVGVRQRNGGTRKQTASGARPRGGSKLPMVSSARPRWGSGGERRAAVVVPNFRCSATRGVPMASGARPGARRVLKNPIFDVERRVGFRWRSASGRKEMGEEGWGGGRGEKLGTGSQFGSWFRALGSGSESSPREYRLR
uniref:Uncharacterized protein n=1 Tax=Ananas comosus var. bracteatus TaxID=296719 RepID=A0A6V7Q5Y5_ANACO|nr:unnamed protein product [Ananas comosus var. bracteatus]